MDPGEREFGQDDPRRRRQFTLLPGEARETTPHQPPTLALVVNADRKLMEAVMASDARQVSTWLERGANPNARVPEGWTLLAEAMSALPGDPAITELLLANGADVRARDKNGQTPLHAAALFADEPQLRLLIDRGRAEIDARDAAGRTPLHLAADVGRVEATAFLVSRGADVSLRDHEGRTPLDCVWKIHAQGILSDHQREQLQRLLGGFMTARIVEARPDALILRVESVHSRFTEADRRATEQGTLTVPCGAFRETHQPGQLVRCEKGLTPALDEAWNQAHKRDLGIERER